MSGQHLRLDDLGCEELLHVAAIFDALVTTTTVHPCLHLALARTAAAARAEVDDRLEAALRLPEPAHRTTTPSKEKTCHSSPPPPPA